jgi:hypothetical protein
MWSMQNQCYAISQNGYSRLPRQAHIGDKDAAAWTESFRELANLLSLKVQAE